MELRTILKGTLLAALLSLGSGANAVLIDFNTCVSSCPNIGAMQGDPTETLATLEYNDNGLGGVDFELTNTIGNRYPGDTESFISELFFGGDGTPLSVSWSNNRIDGVSYSSGGFVNAGITFNWDFNLANSGGPMGNRVLDGDNVAWTISGITEANVFLPAMVHFQSLSTNGESVKISASTVPMPVPAPAARGLLAIGLVGLVGLRRRKA